MHLSHTGKDKKWILFVTIIMFGGNTIVMTLHPRRMPFLAKGVKT